MAGKQQREWLEQELPGWVNERIISPQQAEALRARYPQTTSGRSLGMIIFSTLGALIVGLGIILLFAYNWHAIPKFGKLALVIGPLIAAQATGIFFYRQERWRGLGEALCLLGTMLFGAGIWLVAQIYHIEEHFPNAFFLWGLGALTLALIMPSIPQALLATVLLTTWGGMEAIGFRNHQVTASLILLLSLLPLAIIRRSRLLLATVIPALLLSWIFRLSGYHQCEGWPIFAFLLNSSALLIALSFLVRRYGDFPESEPIWAFYGWIFFVGILFLVSIPAFSREFFHLHNYILSGAIWAHLLIPAAVSLGAWVLLLLQKTKKQIPFSPDDPGSDLLLIPLTVILAYVDLLGARYLETRWLIAGPFNLVFLALAVAMMARGCRQGILKFIIWGALLLIALMIARFFDLFESLIVRGLIFVLVGCLIFAEGLLYARIKKRQKKEGETI